MQVVHLGDRRVCDEPVAHRVRVHMGRSGLQEDPAGLAEQTVARPDHQHHHHERGDRVGLPEAGGEHDQTGDGRPDEGEQVVQDVLVGTLDGQRGPVRLRDAPGRGHVDHDARERGHQDQAALHRRRIHQPPHRLVRQPDRQQDQGQPVGLGGEYLRPLEAVRETTARRTGGEPHRDQREDDRDGVGQHVGRIGDQGQRVGHDADDHLDGHERADQAESDRQPAPVGIGGHAVAVPAVACVAGVVVRVVVPGHGVPRLFGSDA